MVLMKLIRATGFKRFSGFVSPAFFDVVPAGAMMSMGRELFRNYRDQDGLEAARRFRREALLGADLGVVVPAVIEKRPDKSGPPATDDERRVAGEAVLKLYFHQLLSSGPTLLDLSGARFTGVDPVEWHAGPGFVQWKPEFHEALINLYRGFYLDEPATMAGGLEALGLTSAESLFRRHFGDGDQTEVEFSVEHFISSFHDIFEHCKQAGIRLDPNFLPLGIYLATLYEHLETLGVPFDVRSAFLQADRTPDHGDPNRGHAAESTG